MGVWPPRSTWEGAGQGAEAGRGFRSGFVGDVGELLLELAPVCCKREQDERGWGQKNASLPAQRTGEEGTGSAGEPHQQISKIARNRRKKRGEKLGGHKKNPRRRHSKGLKANPALQREQKSLGERENREKSGMEGKGGS